MRIENFNLEHMKDRVQTLNKFSDHLECIMHNLEGYVLNDDL